MVLHSFLPHVSKFLCLFAPPLPVETTRFFEWKDEKMCHFFIFPFKKSGVKDSMLLLLASIATDEPGVPQGPEQD
jgi:hypothetical protein